MKRPKHVHPLSDSELTELQQVITQHPKPRVRVRAIMIRRSRSETTLNAGLHIALTLLLREPHLSTARDVLLEDL